MNIMKTRVQSWQRPALLALFCAQATAQAFYNPTTGRWLNRDPLCESGGQNLSALAANDPVSRVDFLGQISVTIVPPGLVKGECGAFDIRWGIRLDNPAATDGYIVQHIKFTYNARTCQQVTIADSAEYWEAMPIRAGVYFPVDNGVIANDFWHYDPSPNTIGSLQMNGELKFFPIAVTGDLGGFRRDSPSPIFPPWIAGGSYGGMPQIPDIPLPPFPVSSRDLPSTGQQPSFWNQPALEQYSTYHAVTRSWKCCCPWVDPNLGQAF
jgi:hypothetical protein